MHIDNVILLILSKNAYTKFSAGPNDMVNAVYVHAPDKSSGHRVQDVTISYNYIGILPANLLYDVMNGKAA